MASGGSWIRIGAVDAHLDAKTVNSIVKDVLGKKLISVTQMPDLRQEIGEAYIKAVTPFVPKKSGALRESGRATTDGRVYWTAISKGKSTEDGEEKEPAGYNYAHQMYDPDSTRWPEGEYKKPTTPGTYPRWTEKVQPGTAEYDAFLIDIADIIRRRFADNE